MREIPRSRKPSLDESTTKQGTLFWFASRLMTRLARCFRMTRFAFLTGRDIVPRRIKRGLAIPSRGLIDLFHRDGVFPPSVLGRAFPCSSKLFGWFASHRIPPGENPRIRNRRRLSTSKTQPKKCAAETRALSPAEMREGSCRSAALLLRKQQVSCRTRREFGEKQKTGKQRLRRRMAAPKVHGGGGTVKS
jgi:hypothetical protein